MEWPILTRVKKEMSDSQVLVNIFFQNAYKTDLPTNHINYHSTDQQATLPTNMLTN